MIIVSILIYNLFNFPCDSTVILPSRNYDTPAMKKTMPEPRRGSQHDPRTEQEAVS